ncbi:MAG: hypothetical protein MJ066_02380 [Clostridia bacterium]|nr:hypothetical protein [Clostridia bacterium]
MRNLLGVDFGTTSIKACLFNEKGERLETMSKQYKLITEGEFIEFPAQSFFDVFCEIFDNMTAKYKVDALSIDTQGETMIVLDKDGNPLMNAIIWLDNRAEKQAKEFEEHFGLKKVYELTGQAEVPAGYPAPKIMWLKENKPEIFSKADKFLLLEDYIIYKLTGKAEGSRSLYSSSLLMNIKTGEYIDEVLDYIGIDKSQLSVLRESGELVGEYKGVKITTSALDQIAGITGAGVVKEGIISETTGTALAVCAVTKDFPPFYDGLKVSAYYYKKGLYCLLMWAPTAGATLEWVKRTFCFDMDYDKMNELASNVNEGSDGLICIPHLCGTVMPVNNPKIHGSFFNIELKHERGHFIRSVMESVAYMIKEYIDYLNVPVNEIRSVGGGSKSKLWLKIKSAVTGKKVETLVESETACLGSAIFAGVGTGVYDSVESAADLLIAKKDVCEYSSENYKQLYLDYKKKEKEIFKAY